MAKLNPNYRKLSAGYLFPEIARRVREYSAEHPDQTIYRLGIGNTTEPLTPTILQGLHDRVTALGERGTYTGYGDEQGEAELRDALVAYYAQRGVTLDPGEMFVSDGAKADAANIQNLFAQGSVMAIQNPAYPVYVDSNVVAGRTGEYDAAAGAYAGLRLLEGSPDNGWFAAPPGPEQDEQLDVVYLCSPNNPTGAVATREQLQAWVDYARQHRAVIIFDAAYAEFIADPELPRSIYEIEGARECAIELTSFSKFSGFTGVRLGWAVVPYALRTEDSEQGELNRMWNRRQSTFFNGASNIAQSGGVAALSEAGQRESRALVAYYMENARIIRSALRELGLDVTGGDNAPYLWVRTPTGPDGQPLGSWDFFDQLLREAQVVVTPGAGFGSAGEGYVRFSAFGHRENIEAAVQSIRGKLRLPER
ncbi:LL-diaminopimelate aminotransferase [Deinococcus piscis]|uniref:LL-diaminopimelate aminotransferase n=1 Tax=Deinococcus piscis TaxID=394230 RepID=A0ABQ3JZR6_9DEIO|nr:LL-diaminopimelate aminotransferase [Deinococcus piscis]GHF96193.1 LL-diaminopimelate aminotransferase [Deinococcus piscis]